MTQHDIILGLLFCAIFYTGYVWGRIHQRDAGRRAARLLACKGVKG